MPACVHQFSINPGFHEVRRRNTILNARIRTRYEAHYTTNLTVKWVLSGSANYATRQSCYAVDPSCFLLLNHGQTYDLQIRPGDDTETLALFLEPRFVTAAVGALATDEGSLLDDPALLAAFEEPFFERLYPVSGPVGKALHRIAASLRSDRDGEGWIEGEFYKLAAALPYLNGQARTEWTRVPARRGSTRREVYRRLAHARDYAYSCYSDDLSVEHLASVACMSPFHFHRTFRHAFGVTPNAYVQRRRLDVARRLLESTDRSAAQVCREVGFRSLGTFSTLFTRRFGITPGQVRTKIARKSQD